MQFNTQTGRLSSNLIRIFPIFFIILCISIPVFGQMITGVWKGKINRQKAEVKIIQNRDSLTGTAYYFENQNNYRRYSIKGYFNSQTNEVIWWDDQLLEEKSGRINLPFSNPGNPMMSAADFNCPGGKKMFLNGKASTKTKSNTEGSVSLEKTDNPLFIDEWDFIIDNYTTGANNPQLIDSIEKACDHDHDRNDDGRRCTRRLQRRPRHSVRAELQRPAPGGDGAIAPAGRSAAVRVAHALPFPDRRPHRRQW